jgi:hypothetical protein
MIEIDDEKLQDVNLIRITTRCGEAEINSSLKWKSGNKELERYLNKKFNKKCKILQEGFGRFDIAVFILADQASHHLEGKIISYRFGEPQPLLKQDPDQLD